MPKKSGRITLTDNQFKEIKDDNVLETPITNDDEFNMFLEKYFKLDLDLIKPVE